MVRFGYLTVFSSPMGTCHTRHGISDLVCQDIARLLPPYYTSYMYISPPHICTLYIYIAPSPSALGIFIRHAASKCTWK